MSSNEYRGSLVLARLGESRNSPSPPINFKLLFIRSRVPSWDGP